jgi:hypothetical protein
MKKLLLVPATLLVLVSLAPDPASAQRGMRAGGFGGFRGAAIGGGFRGAAIGRGFRGGFAGARFRTAAIGGGWRGAGFGWRGAGLGWRGGLGWGAGWRPGLGVGWRGGLGWAGGWRPGWGWAGGWGRRGWGWGGWGWGGWGWPVAAAVGVGLGASYAGYGDSCLAWNGFTWVNVCYQPFDTYY